MKIAKEFILREIAGEYILVPTGATTQEFNGLITLSETAKSIWENIEKVDSMEEMIQLILEEYEVDEETAKKDANGFISELVRVGFVECTKEDGTWQAMISMETKYYQFGYQIYIPKEMLRSKNLEKFETNKTQIIEAHCICYT